MKNHSENDIVTIPLEYPIGNCNYWIGRHKFGRIDLCHSVMQAFVPSITKSITLVVSVKQIPGYVPVEIIRPINTMAYWKWEIPSCNLTISNSKCSHKHYFGMAEEVVTKVFCRMKRKSLFKMPERFTVWIQTQSAS